MWNGWVALTVWEVGLISQAGAVQELLLELQSLLSPNLQDSPDITHQSRSATQVSCQSIYPDGRTSWIAGRMSQMLVNRSTANALHNAVILRVADYSQHIVII